MHVQNGLRPNPTFIRFQDMGIQYYSMNAISSITYNEPKHGMKSKHCCVALIPKCLALFENSKMVRLISLPLLVLKLAPVKAILIQFFT